MNMPANILDNLKTDETVNNEKDVVGGSGPLDSDIYPGKIEMAYLSKSKGGALGVVLRVKTLVGRELRQTVYVTSGDAKGNKNYYEKDGERNYLPGFNVMNSLCLLTVGKEMSDVAARTETKVVNVYDFATKQEVPTEVPVLVDLLGQEALFGVIRQTVDKRQRGDDGAYHPTGETRDENEIDKIFRVKDKMTQAEILAQASSPEFYNTWVERNRGVTKDKTSKTSGNAGAPQAGNPQASGGSTAKPTKSLFG